MNAERDSDTSLQPCWLTQGACMKNGLYANIHKKRERIKDQKAAGKPAEKMRSVGAKGAPTAKAFAQSKKTAKKS